MVALSVNVKQIINYRHLPARADAAIAMVEILREPALQRSARVVLEAWNLRAQLQSNTVCDTLLGLRPRLELERNRSLR